MVTKINTEDSTHVDDCDRNDDVNGQLFGSQFLVEEIGKERKHSDTTGFLRNRKIIKNKKK